MWKRKPADQLEDEEVQDIRRRRNPIMPLLLGLISGILYSFMEGSISWFFYAFFIVFIISFISQFITGGIIFIDGGGFINTVDSRVICNRCHLVKDKDKKHSCACGGIFEPVENWEWVEDEEV